MKLFIGNLSYDASEAELMDLLSEFEPIVEFHRPLDRETGRPRGFAFVTLADREKGNAAVSKLDGMDLAGRQLRVNEAEDRRAAGGGGGGRPPRPRYDDSNDAGDGEDGAQRQRSDDRPVGSDGKRVRYKGI